MKYIPSYFGMVNIKKSSLYTYYAVESFFARTNFDPSLGDRFYLIDNDNSLLRLPENSKGKCIIIKNEEPKSFAKNVNSVLTIALEDDANLVFLNNDIIFTHDWFFPLLKSDAAITLPCCNQYEVYKNSKFALNVAMDLKDFMGHEKSFEEFIGLRSKERLGPKYIYPLFLPFYCFRLPHAIASKVGLFDEGFGKGGAEDIDYRIRANLHGFEVAIALDSYVLHFMGKSTWRGAETPEQTEERNDIYKREFIKKWGEELANIFLYPSNAEAEIKKHSLERELADQKYKAIIEKCLLP
jgi:GT2 family glycosyltransferase